MWRPNTSRCLCLTTHALPCARPVSSSSLYSFSKRTSSSSRYGRCRYAAVPLKSSLPSPPRQSERLTHNICAHNLCIIPPSSQEESRVVLNSVDNIEDFVKNIRTGQWDRVITSVSTLQLPAGKSMDLFEHICFELAEMGEVETGTALLEQTPALLHMRKEQPNRYIRLNHILRKSYFDPSEVYAKGSSKDLRRRAIAAALAEEVEVSTPSRLLELISQSLKWQQHTGKLPPGSKFDLFRGKAPEAASESDSVPKRNAKIIKFGSQTRAECASFSPDGRHLASGSSDGFVEIWDFETGKLNKSLRYQAEDYIMLHSEPVLSLAWSRDSELLASGSAKGVVKVWRVQTGSCVRTLTTAHLAGVTSLEFAKDATRLLTASFDKTVRLHGLRSGRALKEFKGHTSFVNRAVFSSDFSKALSCSADGTVRVWDVRSCECVSVIRPEGDASMAQILRLPRQSDQFLICGRTHTIRLINGKGGVLQEYKAKADIVSLAISANQKLVYGLGEDHVLYCFNKDDGMLEDVVKLHKKEVLGIVHHPHRNIMASFSVDRTMKIWKSGSKPRKVKAISSAKDVVTSQLDGKTRPAQPQPGPQTT